MLHQTLRHTRGGRPTPSTSNASSVASIATSVIAPVAASVTVLAVALAFPHSIAAATKLRTNPSASQPATSTLRTDTNASRPAMNYRINTNASQPAETTSPTDPRVGALYFPSVLGLLPTLGGPHFCSAAVVHSSGRDIIITAAHCIYGNGAAIEFAPAYNGTTPDGVWDARAVYVDSRWRTSNDPRHDVAFLRVAPQKRAGTTVNIEDVVGAFTLGNAPTAGEAVRVVGYPAGSGGTTVSCDTIPTTTSGYPTVACPGFVDGTSGGPWTHGNTLVGAIGGLNEGGCTPAISYSAPFDASTAATLLRAEAGGHGDTVLPPLSSGC